jgi:hypothetical protein
LAIETLLKCSETLRAEVPGWRGFFCFAARLEKTRPIHVGENAKLLMLPGVWLHPRGKNLSRISDALPDAFLDPE